MRAASDRGFTLVEVVVTVAIVATTVAAGFGISLGARSFAVSAAAAEFDHVLDAARTIARETEGATLAFAPDAYGDGTEVRVLAPGADGTLAATTMPVVHARAAIAESESLGATPFALVIHASGALGGRPGFRQGDTTPATEVGCPASGSFHFVIRTAGVAADRFVPCRVTLAATGPVTLASWPPAPIAPLPTPCTTGPCVPSSLPTPPAPNPPVCPPNYTATPNGCGPTVTPSGPAYHVTATLASPTMTMAGADDTLTARADLRAPVAGAPASLPVILQQATPAICTATPPGPQPSGTTFTLKALSPGTCTIVATADTSAITGATADTQTLNIPITPTPPNPAPSPPTCDLKENGKCYHRIDSGSQRFEKWVLPDISCSVVDGNESCSYIDSVRRIFLTQGYGIKPDLPPVDSSNEILLQIDEVAAAENHCQPYSFFSTLPAENPINWGGYGIGSPATKVMGLGDPSLYFTSNHMMLTRLAKGEFDLTGQAWMQAYTFDDVFDAVSMRSLGAPYQFTFSAENAADSPLIAWYPDFAGCDASGDLTYPHQYGIAAVALVFEIFQAVSPTR